MSQENNRAQLTRVYRKIRAAIEAHNAQAAARENELKAQLDIVRRALLDSLGPDELGFKTEFGTVSKVVKQKFWTVDRAEFNKFVIEHNVPDLYENRIAQRNMADWLTAHPDMVPPGVQMDRRYDVQVVKPRSKPE